MAEPARLFLDTARLGPMSPSAQLAARDFARLAGEGLSTLYLEKFLRRGWPADNAPRRHGLPGLAAWPGLAGLHSLVRRSVRAPLQTPVLLSARVSSLMQITARALFNRCPCRRAPLPQP